jgi:hypothetical protein
LSTSQKTGSSGSNKAALKELLIEKRTNEKICQSAIEKKSRLRMEGTLENQRDSNFLFTTKVAKKPEKEFFLSSLHTHTQRKKKHKIIQKLEKILWIPMKLKKSQRKQNMLSPLGKKKKKMITFCPGGANLLQVPGLPICCWLPPP